VLVCHCKAVSEREVRRAVGAGARTRRQVVRACGAGSVCGGCRPVIDEILAEQASPGAASSAGGRGIMLAPTR
jgi:bacterioferritin-associated ferredoxin